MSVRIRGYAESYKGFNDQVPIETDELITLNKAKLKYGCPYETIKYLAYWYLVDSVEWLKKNEASLELRFENIRRFGKNVTDEEIHRYGACLQDRREKCYEMLKQLNEIHVLINEIIVDSMKDQKQYCDKQAKGDDNADTLHDNG